MTKNPWVNALVAWVYIFLVASVMFYGGRFSGPVHSVVGPMAVIALFTLSAAVMGYVFLYQPFLMYFDNKKKVGLRLFFKTLAIFGGITIVALGLVLSGRLS